MTNGIDIDLIDMEAEAAAYKEDMAQAREDARWEAEEYKRRVWAQCHGNDSGYDPYCDL